MATTKPFSLQGTTFEVFSNPAAQITLDAAIASAMALADTNAKLNALKAAYIAFFAASSQVTATATITVTGGSAGVAAQADGYYTGTFSIVTGGAVSGTWYSTAATATTITATLVPISGSFLASQTGVALASVATTGTNQPTTTVSGTYTSSAATAGSGSVIGKVTAAGDTGKTFTMITEKLINETGTYKGKGSSDEGEFTIDYLYNPSDAGQAAMDLAFNDESSSANRVFRITHLASSPTGVPATAEKVYFSGLVVENKKTRGTIDKISSVKAKIAIQNGLVEDHPA